MSRLRHTCRRTARSALARRARACFRTLVRGPDDLGAALVAFARALRAHRRLARLAPNFFDSVVVDRQRRHAENQRRWMALWEPILDKVYGPRTAPRAAPDPSLPAVPPPHIQRAVEHQLALWRSWLEIGDLALQRHCRRRPHQWVSLNRVTRLLELGFAFGRIACGVDPADPQPENEADSHQQALADLQRACGHLCPPAPPVAATSASASPPDAHSAAAPPPSAGAISTPASPDSPAQTPPSTDPGGSSHGRRDAWSSWARQIRRQRPAR